MTGAPLPPLAAAALDLLRFLDSGICAQLPTHMLRPGGVALPLCARNTGIYTGAALAYAWLRLRGRQRAMLPPPRRTIGLLLALIGVMAADGFNSVAYDLGLPPLYTPSNAFRLATGLGAGVALALLLAPVVARARFGAADRRPPVAGTVSDLGPIVASALLAFPVIWSGAAWTFVPVALVSNAGLVATVVGLNRIGADATRGLLQGAAAPANARCWPVALVFGLAVAELTFLAAIRLALLGPAIG